MELGYIENRCWLTVFKPLTLNIDPSGYTATQMA
jgi:hypothetical protein